MGIGSIAAGVKLIIDPQLLRSLRKHWEGVLFKDSV